MSIIALRLFGSPSTTQIAGSKNCLYNLFDGNMYSILSPTQASDIGLLPGLLHFYPSSFIDKEGFYFFLLLKPCLHGL